MSIEIASIQPLLSINLNPITSLQKQVYKGCLWHVEIEIASIQPLLSINRNPITSLQKQVYKGCLWPVEICFWFLGSSYNGNGVWKVPYLVSSSSALENGFAGMGCFLAIVIVMLLCMNSIFPLSYGNMLFLVLIWGVIGSCKWMRCSEKLFLGSRNGN